MRLLSLSRAISFDPLSFPDMQERRCVEEQETKTIDSLYNSANTSSSHISAPSPSHLADMCKFQDKEPRAKDMISGSMKSWKSLRTAGEKAIRLIRIVFSSPCKAAPANMILIHSTPWNRNSDRAGKSHRRFPVLVFEP
jgi:hypothetical protein